MGVLKKFWGYQKKLGVVKKSGGSKKNLGKSGGTKKIWVYKKKSKKNSSNIKEFPKYQIRLHQIEVHQIEVHQIQFHQIGGSRFKFFGHIQS